METKKSWTGIGKDEVNFTPAILNEELLSAFVKQVLYKLHLKSGEFDKYKSISLVDLTEAVVRTKPEVKKILKIFNTPLLDMPNNERHNPLEKIFKYSFERFATAGIYSNREIAENNQWLLLFKLVSPLKEHLF